MASFSLPGRSHVTVILVPISLGRGPDFSFRLGSGRVVQLGSSIPRYDSVKNKCEGDLIYLRLSRISGMRRCAGNSHAIFWSACRHPILGRKGTKNWPEIG